jgi:hypothetical protein
VIVAIVIEASRKLPSLSIMKNPLLWRVLTFAAVLSMVIMMTSWAVYLVGRKPTNPLRSGLVMSILLALHLAFLRQGMYVGDEGRLRRLMDIMIVVVIAVALLWRVSGPYLTGYIYIEEK